MAAGIQSKQVTVVTVCVCLFISMTTVVRIDAQEVEALLISPPEVAVQPGETAEFVCTQQHAEKLQPLKWLRENGSQEMELDSPRAQDVNGTLTILNTTFQDGGKYICATFDNSLNATATLKVYIMPDYFIEGMIIVGINIALVIVFVGCSVYTFIRNKRAKRKKNRKGKDYQKAGTS